MTDHQSTCSSCGRPVPQGASRCPRCGYELRSARILEAARREAASAEGPGAGSPGAPRGVPPGAPLGGFGPPPSGYGAPYTPPHLLQWRGVDPVAAVRGPAIALMVTGALSVLVCLVAIVFGIAEDNGNDPGGTAVVVVALALGAIASGVMIAGANAMRRLESYGLALAAVILSFLLGLCCTPAIAFGIWGVVVLAKPEVKAAFERRPH